MAIAIKRIYEPATPGDGYRVLVDRLWPRGVSKATAAVDLWLRDVAPSTALRTWFNHDPDKWTEFRARYQAELRRNGGALEPLVTKAKQRSADGSKMGWRVWCGQWSAAINECRNRRPESLLS